MRSFNQPTVATSILTGVAVVVPNDVVGEAGAEAGGAVHPLQTVDVEPRRRPPRARSRRRPPGAGRWPPACGTSG